MHDTVEPHFCAASAVAISTWSRSVGRRYQRRSKVSILRAFSNMWFDWLLKIAKASLTDSGLFFFVSKWWMDDKAHTHRQMLECMTYDHSCVKVPLCDFYDCVIALKMSRKTEKKKTIRTIPTHRWHIRLSSSSFYTCTHKQTNQIIEPINESMNSMNFTAIFSLQTSFDRNCQAGYFLLSSF